MDNKAPNRFRIIHLRKINKTDSEYVFYRSPYRNYKTLTNRNKIQSNIHFKIKEQSF